MVFFCSFVVGLCGLHFVFEVSEGDGFAVGGNFSNELLFARVEAYSFIFRAGVLSFFGIAVVLGAACGAEVCLSIVEAVMVDVINNVAGRNFNYTSMHVNGSSYFSCRGVALGVKRAAVFSNVPFVFAERFIIFGINNGKHALCQGYPAERIAVAEAAIDKRSKDYYAFDNTRDGNNKINCTRSAFIIKNYEFRM